MTTLTDLNSPRAIAQSRTGYFYFYMALAWGLTDDGIAFAIVPLSGIRFFAVVFTLAIAAIRKPDTHKRLMLLAGISLLDAAVARWFLTFPAPPGPSPAAYWRWRNRLAGFGARLIVTSISTGRNP